MKKARGTEVDWAQSRIGRKWSMRSEESLEGRVISAGDFSFTPDGLRVLIAMKHPWLSLNLAERWIDARRFYRLGLWARADLPGELSLSTRTPAGEFPAAESALRVGTKWQRVEADLRKAPWREGNAKRSAWGGSEGLLCQLGMRLAFPVGEKVIVQLRDVELLGDSQPRNEPPSIEPLADQGGRLRFAIRDSAGVWPGSLLIAVNGLVFDVRSRAVRWDGQVLSWDAPHVCDERLTVYLEATSREGLRASLELRRDNPRLSAADNRFAQVGFASARRSKEVRVSGGRAMKYQVSTAGAGAPMNRTIEIRGAVQDPKVTVEGGVDFESPQTVAATLFRPGMTDREKAFAIWRWEMSTAYSLGTANPIDRTKYLNVFGYGYCTSHAQTVQALCEAGRLPWMFLKYTYPGGHGATQFLYDGGWHMLDSHQRLYLLTSDGRQIASAEQIEGDPQIICPGSKDIENYREGQRNPQMYYRPVDFNPIHYTKVYKSILAGSMSQELRPGERLVRSWQGQGRWAHSPLEPLDYANGSLLFRPEATAQGVARESQESRNVECLAGGSGFRPARAGQPARLVYRMASAYLMVGGRVNLTVRSGSARNRVRVAVSTDGGENWREAWSGSRKGEFTAQADFGRFLSKRMVEPDSPIFRDVYGLLVKIEMEAAALPLEVTGLSIAMDLQLHPMSLPALGLGENRLTFSCKGRKGPVTIVHTWDEVDALRSSNPAPCAGEEVTLSARVTNRRHAAAGPLEVVFYDGHPDIDGKPIGKPVAVRSLAAGASVTVKTRWTADTRMHRPFHRPYRGYVHTDLFAVVRGAGPATPSDAVRPVAQLRLTVQDRPRLEVEPCFIGWEPKAPKAGDTVRLFAAVWNGSGRKRPYGWGLAYLNGCVLENVRVRFFAGPPGSGARPIGQCVLPRIDSLEHGLAEVKWRLPRGARQVPIFVEASCAVPAKWGRERVLAKKVLRIGTA